MPWKRCIFQKQAYSDLVFLTEAAKKRDLERSWLVSNALYIVKTFKITGRCVKTVCSLNKEWRAVYQRFGSSLAARLMVVYFKLLWIFSPSKFRIGKCHNYFSGNLFVMHVERLKEVFHCHYFFFLFLLLTQQA